jgi:hypothetical protein
MVTIPFSNGMCAPLICQHRAEYAMAQIQPVREYIERPAGAEVCHNEDLQSRAVLAGDRMINPLAA